MTTALHGVADLVRRASGIRLAEHQHGALGAAIRRAAPGVEPADFLRLAADPARGGASIARLLDEVTVQESAFFRDPDPFERVAWPELVSAAQASGQSVVRVWVAGCAAGEEAYTLAMLASEAFAPHPPPVTILATDVSRRALIRAHAAAYDERALRHVDRERRTRWLRRAGGRLEVREELRQLVQLRHHNLVADPVPPPGETPFHLIACRNVLIYFERGTAAQVAGNLSSALASGGRLVLGAADMLAAASLPRDDPALPAPPRRVTPARPARPGPTRVQQLAGARAAADAGRTGDALARLDALVRRDPLDADAHALRGLVELASGDADAAVASLRRALYAEPRYGLAAYMLGRAHDAAGRPAAARTAYAQALQTLEPADERHTAVFGEVDISDVEAACRARLTGGTP